MEDNITPQWLTSILQRVGFLTTGTVSAIESTRARYAFNSHTYHLVVRYAVDVPDNTPTKFIFKRNSSLEDWYREGGRQEVLFYRLLATLPDHPAIYVRCYAAEYDEQSGNSYLLLEDLSDTHMPLLARVPGAEDIATTMEIMARFHAYWWERPVPATMVEVGRWQRAREQFALYEEHCILAWQHLLQHERAWFPDRLLKFYERLFALLPRLWDLYWGPRFAAHTKLTVAHGDAYFLQFLVPREGITDQTYLIDWQRARIHIGASDLVNMCATFWSREARQQEQRELRVLQSYYTWLCAYGVKNYSWDELLEDYRVSLIEFALVPVQENLHKDKDKAYWGLKMECLVAACEDWDCLALLENKA